MITESLIEPTSPLTNDEWLSPNGHSPRWHKAWDGEKWVETVYTDPNHPENSNVGSNTPALSDSNGQQESNVGADGQTNSGQGEGRQGEQTEQGQV